MLKGKPDKHISKHLSRGEPRKLNGRVVSSHPFLQDRIPTEDELGTETAAEKHLKMMVEKQLDTKLTIKQHFSQHRKFTSPSTYTSLTESVKGIKQLKQFKETAEEEETIQDLRRAGLSEEEINFYLSHKNETVVSAKHFPTEPNILEKRMKIIEDQLKLHEEDLSKPEVFYGAKTLSRNEMDIEKSLYAGCNTKTKMIPLLTSEKDFLDPNDPFKYIKDLSEKLIGKVHKNRKRKRKECRNYANDLKNESESELSRNAESQDFTYDPNIHHVIVPLEESEVIEKRLTVDEIKKLPRFENYHPGDPNKVLYLKNLHPKVTIYELQSLFGSFDVDNAEPIDYRILAGKMKGQAFVTFSDVMIAQKALKFSNGYMLRHRPIIVHYGKKKD